VSRSSLERGLDAADETGDMVVVTITLPSGLRDDLSVTVREHTVTVTAAGGYRREIVLPPEAETAHLHAQLYDAFLELRAPRGSAPPERPVQVRVLR
jgi:HSP20 family molecular chaperone IbpA